VLSRDFAVAVHEPASVFSRCLRSKIIAMTGAKFLGTDMRNPDVVPYFTWDAPLTVREIHEQLHYAPEAQRYRLLGKILREARDTDVWVFTSPEFVSRNWDQLNPYLGRRRPFWEWLLRQWKEERLLAS
jgi:hypothetical protein